MCFPILRDFAQFLIDNQRLIERCESFETFTEDVQTLSRQCKRCQLKNGSIQYMGHT